METKYGYFIDKEVIEQERKRIINQLWKLIPMRENKEDWQAHLNTVTVEIAGLGRLFSLNFLILLAKLEGLVALSEDIDFFTYRRTVFKCIDLFVEVINNER